MTQVPFLAVSRTPEPRFIRGAATMKTQAASAHEACLRVPQSKQVLTLKTCLAGV